MLRNPATPAAHGDRSVWIGAEQEYAVQSRLNPPTTDGERRGWRMSPDSCAREAVDDHPGRVFSATAIRGGLH